MPAAEALPTRPLVELAEDAVAFGHDPATRVIEPNGVHPLLYAIGRAFADSKASLAMVLDAALDSGGDIAHAQTERERRLQRAGHDE